MGPVHTRHLEDTVSNLIFTISTQYLRNIYTVSTQYLRYTVTSHHGQESGNTLGTGVGTGIHGGDIKCVDC